MAVKIETYTHLSRINDAVDCTIYIESVTQIGATNVYRITTFNTKWVSLKRNVTISGETYLVNDIVANTSIDIVVETGQPVPSTSTFTIAPMYFHKGTFNFISAELTSVDDADKSPMLIFRDPSTDRVVTDALKSIDRYSDCELLVLLRANFEDWTKEQHYNYAIVAAGNYFDQFIIAAKNYEHLSELTEEYTSENHVKFGVFNDSKGHTHNLMNDNLSGKRHSITLPFMKVTGCVDPYIPPSDGSGTINVYLDSVLQSTTESSNLDAEIVNILWT